MQGPTWIPDYGLKGQRGHFQAIDFTSLCCVNRLLGLGWTIRVLDGWMACADDDLVYQSIRTTRQRGVYNCLKLIAMPRKWKLKKTLLIPSLFKSNMHQLFTDNIPHRTRHHDWWKIRQAFWAWAPISILFLIFVSLRENHYRGCRKELSWDTAMKSSLSFFNLRFS